MEYQSEYDSIFKQKLKDGPNNGRYTSPEIQNSILGIMVNLVRKEICMSFLISGEYTLLADECRDVSKQEQISVALRYVDVCNGCVQEHFLTFAHLVSLNAHSLAKYLLDTYELQSQNMVSQGYDGASLMSGRCNGVQKKVKEEAPHARYIHCYAHILNLVLVDSVKKVQEASEFFALLQALLCFCHQQKPMQYFWKSRTKLHLICSQCIWRSFVIQDGLVSIKL